MDKNGLLRYVNDLSKEAGKYSVSLQLASGLPASDYKVLRKSDIVNTVNGSLFEKAKAPQVDNSPAMTIAISPNASSEMLRELLGVDPDSKMSVGEVLRPAIFGGSSTSPLPCTQAESI